MNSLEFEVKGHRSQVTTRPTALLRWRHTDRQFDVKDRLILFTISFAVMMILLIKSTSLSSSRLRLWSS